jgi:Fe-S oxidoreductase
MINPKLVARIIAHTDTKTKLRLAKVIPKLGKADEITKCMLCPNMCLHVCPVFDAERRLTVSPSVKARLGYFANDPSYEVFEALYRCLPCNACKEACPMDISVSENLREIRSKFKTELGEKAKNEFERRMEEVERKMSNKERDGKILYFPGCSTFESNLFDRTLELLEKLNLDFGVSPDAICCGMPYMELGYIREFRENMEKLKKITKKYEGVVSNCPHCVLIMQENGIKAAHILSAIIGAVSELQLRGSNVLSEISYHDPCILARKLGILDEPRNILRKAGFTVHEPIYTGKETYCCGFGGIYRFIDPENAEKISERRKQQFEYEIVTACPSCKQSLNARDIVEVLLDVL